MEFNLGHFLAYVITYSVDLDPDKGKTTFKRGCMSFQDTDVRNKVY